ncbi:spermatogenesis-defective protein 39 homolog [Gigantopelta aegis]|uniref:spermatogenesis-defective protein 39 homolog n=1 Tax=Gigantopelta aegis TaxID=1735272 RepID=UPI001B88C9CA|nr:spermatogenesis-defective protein 39 homolog [Gigantopelta aegis]
MEASRKSFDDSEEYWATSSVKKGAQRNIFDDDVSFEDAKRNILASPVGEDDDDDLELVNWDDSPVVKYNSKATAQKNFPPDLSDLAVPFTSPASRAHSASGYQSSDFMNHSRSQSLGKLGSSKGLGDIGSEKMSLYKGSSEPSIEEAIGPFSEKTVSQRDIDKMQNEIQYLRRTVQSFKRGHREKLPVEDTLQRMIKGEAYSFEMYRSREDKVALLDKAIELHDGNAIIAATLFLKHTVKSSIFNLELTRRSAAVNHYITYLRNHYDYVELSNVLGLLGRTEEAAMLTYKTASASKDPTLKLSALKSCYRAHFSLDSSLSHEASLVQQHIDLLERQAPIEKEDARLEAEGRTQIFKDIPRKSSLINMSVITTLYYCCLYHYELGENSLSSPLALQRAHQLSERQYLWIVIAARGRLRKWDDIKTLLTAKGWFGGTKMKAVIGFDKVCEILHKVSAPHSVLASYIALIDDSERRLAVAKKVNCPKGIIETYVALKDRSELEAYASKLPSRSEESIYANDVLRSSTIKWK